MLSIARILNNSNFDKSSFTEHLGLVEKTSFILIKHSLGKLTKINERMYAASENILNLSEWVTFRSSGKYAEI